MKVKRAVIDTNVLISAALSARTPPALVVRFFLEHGCIVFSQETFAEFESRLWHPKFDRYLSIETRKALLHDFNAVADWVSLDDGVIVTSVAHSRDADDDKFVHTALIGGADVLVSGDRDLLDIESSAVSGVKILSPVDTLLQLDAWRE